MGLLHREPDVERADDCVGRTDRDIDNDGVDSVERHDQGRTGMFGARPWHHGDHDHDGVPDDRDPGTTGTTRLWSSPCAGSGCTARSTSNLRDRRRCGPRHHRDRGARAR